MPRRRIPLVWIVLAVLLLWDGVGWLVIGALLHPLLPGGWRTIVIAAVLVLAPFAKLARSIGGAGYPTALTRLLLFRPFWYAQLLLPLLTIAGLTGLLAGLPFGAGAAGGRIALAGAAVLLAILIISGYVGTRQLAVRRLDVSFPDLPEDLDGLKVVQLSDLHVGPHTSRRHLARIADAVRDAAPDLIALTGDQVDDYARDVEAFAAAFGGLAAPLGVFAIAGNHDIIAGWNGVRQGLERLGIVVLVNRALLLEGGRVRFWIAGIGDPAGRGWRRGGGASAAPDLERTLAGVPMRDFTLALAHNPALWPALAERGVDLTLSGHTHYGQLAIPRLNWSLASNFLELAMGIHAREGSLLYINPGTNFWGIPFRLGTPPEVTVLTLRRAAAGSKPRMEEVAWS
jgi:predicted MPP superfamily phosphohydrolase